MKRLHRAVPACAVAAALTVAGCGGLSKDDLAAKAGAICAKYAKQGQALGRPNFDDPAAAAAYFIKARDLARRQQKELTALEAPDEARRDYRTMTDSLQTAVQLLGRLADAAKAEDNKQGLALAQRLRPLTTRVSNAANAVGAESCGSGS